MSDYSIFDAGCSCFISAPCSFCVETYECSDCGTRSLTEEEPEEAVNNEICGDCLIEKQYLARRAEGWRPISAKRKRTLRRRGEHVQWIPEFDAYGWIPPTQRLEGSTND